MTRSRLPALLAATALLVGGAASADAGGQRTTSAVLSGPSPLTGERCDGATPTEVESFPWLAVHRQRPQDRVAVWMQDGEAGVVGATTTNGGRRWRTTVPGPLVSCRPGDALHVSEPRVAVTPSGSVWATAYTRDASTTSGHVVVARSTDGGRTWVETSRPDLGLEPLGDFDALAVAPDRPDTAYVLWSQPEVAGEPTVLSRSSDGGATWSRSLVRVAVPGTASWSSLAVLPGRRLVVVYQDAPLATLASPVGITGPVWAVTSADDGTTWSAPALLGQGTPLQWPAVAVAQGGDVYASWVRPGTGDCRRLPPAGESGTGCEAVVARSTDGGTRWTTPTPVLAWTGAWIPTPGLAVTSEGTVGVLATVPTGDGRLQPVLAESTDCGATWRSRPVADPTTHGPGMPGEADGHGLALQLVGLDDAFTTAVVRGAPDALTGTTDVVALEVPAGRGSC